MNLAVDKPILNSPYEEPTRYWLYESGQPKVVEGRRPAGYYFKARARTPKEQLTLLTDEQFVELETVNRIRRMVGEWRKDGYPGVTPITRRLLQHWNSTDRERRLFFCQIEAAETIIWLTEIYPKRPRDLKIPLDEPTDPESVAKGYRALRRYGCKMATGSGKTVLMAMIAAWSVLNKAQYPQDRRFSDAILVVAPNLTVRERLQVLLPWREDNYYTQFDLVPAGLRDQLGKGKFLIINWHKLAPQDDSRKRSVMQRGPESDAAFAARVLHDLGRKQNLLVMNDEAHHAYRPAPLDDETRKRLTPEQIRDREEATDWVTGLDRIHAARHINFCLDVSATPFYIQGSGHPEGSPLPWLVSDFGLVDAIECGIVKIPRVPVDDNTGQPIPKYFALWKAINDALAPADRATARRKPNPEAVLREAEGALQQLAGLWKETFEQFQRDGYRVPPVMIVVCDNTDLAQVIYQHISGESQVGDDAGKKRTAYGSGKVFPELLQNTESFQPTLRIDTRLLAEAEIGEDGKTREQAADALRLKVGTVGKPGQPGEQVRCVVSVGMLTEGWDANNVKQVLGLRAFQSQLLCEQVVGRGLRRMSYEVDPETGLLTEDYVDVYGIPFEVIPVKKKPTGPPPPPPPSTLVQALKEREHLKIEFPRVEGYVFDVRERIRAEVGQIPPLTVEPSKEPTEVIARAKVGIEVGAPSLLGPGEAVTQTREEFYASVRFQQIEYEIARRVTQALLSGARGSSGNFRLKAAHMLFPQVLRITREFLGTRVDYGEADRREIGLEKYVQQVVERLCAAIEPDEEHGEVPLRPRIEQFRPKGSTSEVLFRTVRPCKGTIKSHVSHVVLDAPIWEASVAFRLEQSPEVESYVRNDHLDFVIPYEYQGQPHAYMPDYLVRLRNGLMVILEVKGFETEEDRQKYAAAQRWVKAVNHHGGFGRWEFVVCKGPRMLGKMLQSLSMVGGTS